MSNEEIEDYFEQLATTFKPIAHTPENPRFCRFDIVEVVTKLAHTLDLTQYCLMLESPAGSLEDNNGDGYFDNQEIAFMVVRQVELRNSAEEKQVLSESRQLALKVLARIIEQRQFTDIDENTIDYEKVGPLWGQLNCYGYRYSFTATSTLDLSTDPNDWNE